MPHILVRNGRYTKPARFSLPCRWRRMETAHRMVGDSGGTQEIYAEVERILITDQRAESAVMHIRTKAAEYASAKASRVYIEEYRKSKKALAMRDAELHGHTTSASQEREAYASEEYVELLSGLKAAVELEEKLRWEMVSAQLTVEIWRTQSANARMEIKAAT